MTIAEPDHTTITAPAAGGADPRGGTDPHAGRIAALAGVGVWRWWPATGAARWSRQLRDMVGLPADAPLAQAHLCSVIDAGARAAFATAADDAIARRGTLHRTERVQPADGAPARVLRLNGEVVDAGGEVMLLVTCTDVTDEQAAADHLAYLAAHDPLTGLHNRRGMLAVLTERVEVADGSCALLLLDIDHLKDINDLRGHAAGDQVIRAFASHLADLLPGAVLGRLGGDEFAVLLDDHDAEAGRTVAERLCDDVNATPVVLPDGALRLTISAGVAALSPGCDTEAVLADADLALYEAKAAGRNCVRASLPEQHERARRRMSVHQRLAEALAGDLFVLLAQPIVDLRTDEVSAWELLLRLRDGNQPDLPPDAFLPTAERSTLARRVDRWVVERAIRALATPAARRHGLCVQVNVTTRSLEDPQFGDAILAALRDAGVNPHRLGLEITETATITNVAAVRALVSRLGGAGCPIVLDDFGVGFGSLVSLRDVPFAAVKIAGPFVEQADRTAASMMVIDGIVRMARGLNMQVIAEQVDRQPLLQALREAGVRGAQGYLLGAPRPLDEVLAARA